MMGELRLEVQTEMRNAAYRAKVQAQQCLKEQLDPCEAETAKRRRYRQATREKSAALEKLMQDVADAQRRLQLLTDKGKGGDEGKGARGKRERREGEEGESTSGEQDYAGISRT